MHTPFAVWLLGAALACSAPLGSITPLPQGQQQQQAQQPSPATPTDVTKPAQNEPAAAAPTSDAKATLYVYRPRRYTGAALKPSVYADDTELARLENGRFFVAKLSPGAHTIRSNDKASGVALEMVAGADYYVRIDIEPGAWKGHGKLTLVLPEQGQYEVKQEKPLSDSDVKNREFVGTN